MRYHSTVIVVELALLAHTGRHAIHRLAEVLTPHFYKKISNG